MLYDGYYFCLMRMDNFLFYFVLDACLIQKITNILAPVWMGLDPRFNRVDSVLLELPYDGLLGIGKPLCMLDILSGLFTIHLLCWPFRPATCCRTLYRLNMIFLTRSWQTLDVPYYGSIHRTRWWTITLMRYNPSSPSYSNVEKTSMSPELTLKKNLLQHHSVQVFYRRTRSIAWLAYSACQKKIVRSAGQRWYLTIIVKYRRSGCSLPQGRSSMYHLSLPP